MNQNHSAYFFKGEAAGSIVYHNNTARVTTTSTGINVTGNNVVSGNVTAVDGTFSGNVSIGGTLTYEDVTNIDSVGIVTARDGVFIPDNKELKIGQTAGTPDLKIYSDGTSSFIREQGPGSLYIQGVNVVLENTSGTNYFAGVSGAESIIYHNGSPKITTSSTGATVTGGITATSTSAGAHQFATSGTPTSFAVTGQAEVTIGGGATKDNALAIESNTTAGLDYDSNIVLARSRGTHANKGLVQLGDFLGRVGFYGYDGSEYERAAEIAAVVSAGAGTNDMPTQLQFKTTPNGQNVPTTKLIVHHGGNIEIPNDYAELQLGNDQDLRLYHNGTQGKLDNHTGKFKIRSNAIKLSNLAETYTYIECAPSGQQDVQLFYNNTIKFQTTSSGATVTGKLGVGVASPSSELEVQGSAHTNLRVLSGDNSNIGFFQAVAGQDLRIGTSTNSPLHLFVNGVNRVNIDTSGNVSIPHDGTFLQIGASQDLDLHHNGTNSYIRNKTGDLHIRPLVAEEGIILKPNGAVELYHDNAKKFETSSDGTKFSGSALFPDNQRIKVGGDASTPDLQIWHDGSHTRVSHTGTGQLIISGNDNDQVKLMKGNSEEGVILNNNGNVELYHNNNKRFETTDYGATIDGRLRCYATPQSTSATTPIALTLSSYTNSAEEGPYMVFNSKWMNGYDNWVVGAIAGIYETQSPGGSNAGAIVFRTNYNNNGAQGLAGTSEKMRIRGDGQVRIQHSASNTEIEHAALRVTKTGTSYTDKTMLSLENGDGTAGDLDYQTSHIDFSFFDTNTNVYPQVRISAHVGDGSNADSQIKEGKGWLSFHCSNTGAISGQANPTEHFRIKHDGTLLGTDTSIGSLCDSRLKKDITDYSYSLDVFKQFKPKTFNWINPDLHGKHTNQRGFIAQEVESIDSYFTDQAIVDEKIDDYNLVSDGLAKTTKLVEKDAMYISVIQQMIDKIEKLETEVAALKGS